MDPGVIEDGDGDMPQYNCDEEWYNPDIYLSTVGKEYFNKTQQSSKEELDFKAVMKECDTYLTRKNNLLML